MKLSAMSYALMTDVGSLLCPERTMSGWWVATEDPAWQGERVLAMHDRRRIASLCYCVRGTTLISSGTFVARRHRRLGVALALWRYALDSHSECKIVSLDVCSDRGMALAQALRRIHSGRDWRIGDARMRRANFRRRDRFNPRDLAILGGDPSL